MLHSISERNMNAYREQYKRIIWKNVGIQVYDGGKTKDMKSLCYCYIFIFIFYILSTYMRPL